MVHPRPVILALLIAVAAPVAAVPSSAPMAQSSATTQVTDVQVYAPENTSAVLTLGEDAEETRAFVRPSLDVGTSIAIETDDVTRRLNQKSFETQFSRLESEGDKRDLIFKYATQLQTRTETLENQEQNVRRGVRNGSISAAEYVRTMARINQESNRLQGELGLIKSYTDRVQFPLNDYLGSLEKRLVSLEGPVQNETVWMLTGDSPSATVYIGTAGNGVVLSMIDEGVYTREVFRDDLREVNTDGRLSSDQAESIINQTYPWAYDQKNADEWWGGGNINGYHTYDLGYPHGRISAHIDTNTKAVFKASQRKYLTPASAQRNGGTATMPKGPGVTANESGLLLTVNRSYPGGPMYVTLQDNETGDYVEGTVAINGETVGETSMDGGLWTLSPAGTFNVSASSGLDVVTVETRPTRPLQRHNATQG